MPRLLQVARWRETFENNKSRERDRCSWVPIPNAHDGRGLNRLLALPDGLAVFGMWNLLVQACSRQRRPRDGWLTDDGTRDGEPWTVADLAFRWRRSEAEVGRAIDVLSDVGWLVDFSDAGAQPGSHLPAARPVPAECPSGAQEGKEVKGREVKGRGGENDTPPPPRGFARGESPREIEDATDGVAELRPIPGIQLPRRDRPAWVALLASVGIDCIREGVAKALADGKPGHVEHVTPFAYQLANGRRSAVAAVRAAGQADARREREAQVAAEMQARATGTNLTEATALLAEVDAAAGSGFWSSDVDALRQAVAAGKVGDLKLHAVRSAWARWPKRTPEEAKV